MPESRQHQPVPESSQDRAKTTQQEHIPETSQDNKENSANKQQAIVETSLWKVLLRKDWLLVVVLNYKFNKSNIIRT